MSEPRFDSLYSAWATIAGGTGYDSTYSAMKAALEKVTGQENYDSVYSIAADFADDVEAGSASVAKNTQLNEEITENGTYTFTPDEGYVYDSVTVSVDAGSKAEGTIKIVNNGTYDVTSYAQANVAVGGESYSYKVNQVDEEGLRAIGWDDESIGYFRDNFGGIYPWEADSYKVSDENKALYGVVTGSSTMSTYNNVMKYCPFITLSNGTRKFQNCTGLIGIPKLDTSRAATFSNMFDYCTSLTTIPPLDTSSGHNMSGMFRYCRVLREIPFMETSKVESMLSMFDTCTSLTTIPLLDTSSVTDMRNMFSGCSGLTRIPALNCESVTSVETMFYLCTNLTEIPDMNFKRITSFPANAYSTWICQCTNLRTIGVVDCDSVTDIRYSLHNKPSGGSTIVNLGGFRNLGKASSVAGTDGDLFLNYAPNLTYESVMNVLNLLYDRASAGMSVLTLKLHANHLAMLSEDDIAIATNKGWTLV